jgi:putative transposase
MKIEIVKDNHSAGESNFHYQFTPAYRRAIFSIEKVRKLVKRLGVVIVTLEFGPDHLHVFLADCKNYSASKLAQELKGFVSYIMRKNHMKLFGHLLWGDKFWTSGYFYRSIGQATNEAVRFYIEYSQAKHLEVVDYEFYQYSNQATLKQF